MTEGVFLVVKPEFGCPTGEAYRKYDESPLEIHGGLERFTAGLPGNYAPEMYSVFQKLYSDRRIEDICDRLTALGAKGAMLTGSGSAVFGVFDNEANAKRASGEFPGCFTAVSGCVREGVSITEREVL